MRWTAGGRRDTGLDCVLVEEGNRFDVIVGPYTGEPNVLWGSRLWVRNSREADFLDGQGVHGRTVGYLFVACRELSSHIRLACVGCSCIDGHNICITSSFLGLKMVKAINIIDGYVFIFGPEK